LQRLSSLPWVADFRDPMAQTGYPADPKTWKSFKRIEETALQRAAISVFVTAGAARMYRERYPEAGITVIENGYEEESFGLLEDSNAPLVPEQPPCSIAALFTRASAIPLNSSRRSGACSRRSAAARRAAGTSSGVGA